MKLNPTKLQKTAIIAAIAICSTSMIAFAQSAPPPPGGPQSQSRDHRRANGHDGQRTAMQPGGLRIEQIGRLKNSLKLNAQQSALWDKAEKAMQPAPDMRAKLQEQMKTRHDQTLAALADPKFDPRKFSADMEKQRSALQAEQKARVATVREAWFSVYDSLDAGQRGQVREFLRERFESRKGKGMGRLSSFRGGRAWGANWGANRGAPGDAQGWQARPPIGQIPPAGPAGNMPPPARP